MTSAMRPTPRKPERPVFWIIAGPNGSGKSSFYNRTDFEGWGGSVWIINPDLDCRPSPRIWRPCNVLSNGSILRSSSIRRLG